MANFKLSITHFKILATVEELNKNGFYPGNEGIFKIVTGKKDDETLMFKEYKTYSTLISYPSKKICCLTLALQRHGYLEKVFDPDSNELYFRVTKLGLDALKIHNKSRNSRYVKKEVIEKPTIVKIPNLK